jgi:2,4-dienoyl-CoA reductase-like NADH-dependent reductase (Old Yellow Enzyme family)
MGRAYGGFNGAAFTPFQLGKPNIANSFVMAPMTARLYLSSALKASLLALTGVVRVADQPI